MRRDGGRQDALASSFIRLLRASVKPAHFAGVVIIALLAGLCLPVVFEAVTAGAAQTGKEKKKVDPAKNSNTKNTNAGKTTGKPKPKPPVKRDFSIVTNPDNFVRIEPGEFMMGSESGDADADEKPVHRVRISRPFEMGKYEVTQAQWEAVTGSNPSYFKGADLPVERVSWDDAQQFIQKLNAQNDGHIYRLPTEAEWEYACRAGSTGDYAGNLDAMGWYDKNSGHKTNPVGQKQPNAWGLYDMHGNVWEWCQDWYGENYYAQSPGADPQGPASGSGRVTRGGGWIGPAAHCRSAFRIRNAAGFRYILGFRLARTPR
jgi:formylglycine-generating enzyme required for sulfatase activity